MVHKSIILSLTAAFGLLALAVASASETKVGTLVIESPTIRGTIKTAKVAAGYLSIKNTGTNDDRLLGGSVTFAKSLQVHEMKVTDGVMTMRSLKSGLLIPAGKTVALKRGAEHLMFMKLAEPMLEGEIRMVTLEFEKAGTVEVMFPVGNLAGDPVEHSEHGEHSGHGDHSNQSEKDDHSGHSD